MSDWSAQVSGVASALAGLDMTMPGDTDYGNGISYWGGQ
jgi:beta-glucosidase